MWCLNCGRKQPPKAGYCRYCGETKEVFSEKQPKTPDAVFAKNLNLQSMAYYFVVLSGFLLVLLEVAAMVVYAVNLFRLILSESVVIEEFYASMVLQPPFSTIFAVVADLVVALLGSSLIIAGVFTKTKKRRILSFVSGGLLLVWLLLELVGAVSAMGVSFVMIAMVLVVPMIVGFFGHPYLSKKAIGAVIRIVIAALCLFLVPMLFKALVNGLFGMFGFDDFAALCDPFVTVVSVVVIAVTQVSAVSRVALFFSQMPDLCRPRRVKKAPRRKQVSVNESRPRK